MYICLRYAFRRQFTWHRLFYFYKIFRTSRPIEQGCPNGGQWFFSDPDHSFKLFLKINFLSTNTNFTFYYKRFFGGSIFNAIKPWRCELDLAIRSTGPGSDPSHIIILLGRFDLQFIQKTNNFTSKIKSVCVVIFCECSRQSNAASFKDNPKKIFWLLFLK